MAKRSAAGVDEGETRKMRQEVPNTEKARVSISSRNTVGVAPQKTRKCRISIIKSFSALPLKVWSLDE